MNLVEKVARILAWQTLGQEDEWQWSDEEKVWQWVKAHDFTQEYYDKARDIVPIIKQETRREIYQILDDNESLSHWDFYKMDTFLYNPEK